jgi:hypothetical protein
MAWDKIQQRKCVIEIPQDLKHDQVKRVSFLYGKIRNFGRPIRCAQIRIRNVRGHDGKKKIRIKELEIFWDTLEEDLRTIGTLAEADFYFGFYNDFVGSPFKLIGREEAVELAPGEYEFDLCILEYGCIFVRRRMKMNVIPAGLRYHTQVREV